MPTPAYHGAYNQNFKYRPKKTMSKFEGSIVAEKRETVGRNDTKQTGNVIYFDLKNISGYSMEKQLNTGLILYNTALCLMLVVKI